ncbi:MAG: hypothetical protein U0941_24750 [Planctomycetaceae bacterium]
MWPVCDAIFFIICNASVTPKLTFVRHSLTYSCLLAINDGLPAWANFCFLEYWQESICLALLGLLLCTQLFDCRSYLIFPRQFLILGGVVGREVGDGDVHMPEQFGGLGEFVAVDIGLAVGPGLFVGGEGVVSGFLGVADGKPELGEEAMRGVAELGQALGYFSGIGELAEVVRPISELISMTDRVSRARRSASW